MNKEKLLEYLDFLKIECLRYSADRSTDENEIRLLQLEIDKFLNLFHQSDFDQSIQNIVLNIDFTLAPTTNTKFLSTLTSVIGSWWFKKTQDQEELANTLKKIALELENAIFEIKAFV